MVENRLGSRTIPFLCLSRCTQIPRGRNRNHIMFFTGYFPYRMKYKITTAYKASFFSSSQYTDPLLVRVQTHEELAHVYSTLCSWAFRHFAIKDAILKESIRQHRAMRCLSFQNVASFFLT